jgi:hypothetical protein
VARLEGDSSRTARISAAGTNAKTSCTEVAVSAQNWSQKASSVASTGYGGETSVQSYTVPLPTGPQRASRREATNQSIPRSLPTWVRDILQVPKSSKSHFQRILMCRKCSWFNVMLKKEREKKKTQAGHQWLTPIIIAIWFKASPGKKLARPHLSEKKLVWQHVPIILVTARSVK